MFVWNRIVMSIVSLCVSLAFTQEYMPPDRPPPVDYQIQGEYFGTLPNGDKLGAWVVARGSNRYDLSLLPGGLLALPNDTNLAGGWNGTTKHTGSGTLNGTTYNVNAGNGYSTTSITGSGADRSLHGSFNGADFTLKRLLRQSPTLGLRPEGKDWGTNAQSWFNSSTAQADLSKWTSRDNGVELKYGNFLFRGIQSSGAHGTVFLHIEVKSPFVPTGTGQNRGNSGIYLRARHEMQVLDSFGGNNADDHLGGIYGVHAPTVNAALPPLTWQTYDCYYTAGSGNNGTFTVYLNGVLVQDNKSVNVITEAGYAGNGIYLQNHGSEVIYNNIWIIHDATTENLPWEEVLPIIPVDTAVSVGFRKFAPRESFSNQFFDVLGRKASQPTDTKLMVLPLYEQKK